MKRVDLVWSLLLSAVALCSELDQPPPRGITLAATVERVVDADTVDVQPTPPIMRVRLLDCWAAEANTPEGMRGTARMRQLLPVGAPVTVFIPTEAALAKSLTFGRVLGKVWRDVDADGIPDNVNMIMIREGLATEKKPKKSKASKTTTGF